MSEFYSNKLRLNLKCRSGKIPGRHFRANVRRSVESASKPIEFFKCGIESKVSAEALNIDQIIELSPFIKREIIDMLIIRMDQTLDIMPEHLYRLAPYMSKARFD